MDGRADCGAEAWEQHLAGALNFPADVWFSGFDKLESRARGKFSVESIGAIWVSGTGMYEQQVSQCQRCIAGGDLRGIHAGRGAHPAVIADVPAGGLAWVGGVIDESETFELVAGG